MMSTEPAEATRSYPADQPTQHYPQQPEDEAHLAKFLRRGAGTADIDNPQNDSHNGNEEREQIKEQAGF